MILLRQRPPVQKCRMLLQSWRMLLWDGWRCQDVHSTSFQKYNWWELKRQRETASSRIRRCVRWNHNLWDHSETYTCNVQIWRISCSAPVWRLHDEISWSKVKGFFFPSFLFFTNWPENRRILSFQKVSASLPRSFSVLVRRSLLGTRAEVYLSFTWRQLLTVDFLFFFFVLMCCCCFLTASMK